MVYRVHWAVVLILFLLSGALPSQAATKPGDLARGEWEDLGESQGVQTLRWRSAGQDLFAFKGIGVIDAPIAKIATVLDDWRHQAEWMPDLVDVRMVRQLNPLERIQYMHFSAPFLLRDRDFVVSSRVHFDPETHVIRIDFHSVLDERAPETRNVRGRIVAGQFLLEPLAEEAGTRMTMQIHLDPGGFIPRWIVNLTQRSFPRRAISALRELSTRAGVRDHPLVRAVLDGEITSEAEAMVFPAAF